MSVVLATFNGAQFLDAQLESILNQTRLPDEVIIGDDGSTDVTPDILERFQAHAPFPVKVLHRQRVGVGNNFLDSLEAARGDLVAFSDQDDVWLPGKLQQSERLLHKYKADLLRHRSFVVEKDLGHRNVHLRTPARRHLFVPRSQFLWQTLPGNVTLFRRAIMEGVHWRERPRSQWWPNDMNHDELLNLVASIRGTILWTPERLLLYRQHDTNVAGAKSFMPALADMSSDYSAGPEYRADLATEWRQWFRGLVDLSEQSAVDDYFERAALAQGRRADMLRSQVPSTVLNFSRNVIRGDYRSRRPYGLGWRALLRDSYNIVNRLR